MIEVSVLVDKINGMSHEEISQMLTEQHITGYEQDERSCPLAHWFHKESGREVAVGVHRKSADGTCQFGIIVAGEDYYKEEYTYDDGDFFEIGLGPRNFIVEFDHGRYPDLVEPLEDWE